jgi:CHAT domain-containing protein
MPVEWSAIMTNLGTVYRERIRGDRAENFEQAIHHYQQALKIQTFDMLPENHLMTQHNLGNLYFEERQWVQAHQAYDNAIAVSRALLQEAYSESGRQAKVEQIAVLYAQAAYCLVQMGDYDAALVQLDAGKTRLLAEVLSLSEADTSQLSKVQSQALIGTRQRIRELEAEYRTPLDTSGRRPDQVITGELRDTRAMLNNLIDSIRTEQPDFMPEGLDLPSILALIPSDGALVAPVFTSQGSVMFVVPYGVDSLTEEHIIWLNEFVIDDLIALLRGTEDNPGWLRAYFARSADMHIWLDQIDVFTRQLWEQVLTPVHARLQALGVQRVILVPQGRLGLLPLHAAWHIESGAKRYFVDDYIVQHVPSAYSLHVAQRRLAQRNSQQSALIAGVSEYQKLNNLPNVHMEVETLATLFSTSALMDAQATPQAIIDGSSNISYLHLACHGAFAWDVASQSALVLGGDQPLTLANILGKLNLNSARLVTLSACETGISDVKHAPDEYVGLPAGFMQAGAPGVISSLWTVEDRSTALLMERFYQHHLNDHMPPAEALREAQLWLRDITYAELGDYLESQYRLGAAHAQDAHIELLLTEHTPDEKPYAHPYFWAAFTFNGA